MDIISQLQEQVNSIAALAFNTIGTMQRDAPPVRLSANYPEPPPSANPTEETAIFSEQPKLMSAALVKAAKQMYCFPGKRKFCTKQSHWTLLFDALVAALPISEGGEEAQLKKIADLQAENDAVGQDLQKQLEAAEKELKLVQELFSQASDGCLNLKMPD
ncbi:mediator of RNA polymerase II transcription subunit 21-like [Quillaja saponaria]|uniref:Mediator of RNA polymerase II transcription subunit 21 n=1 Tax=Quillaja saponaria TaxID=32244 RepID=A0AAD7VG98_QUISA|nr:mediator of RNA polymerase II transcription subunit 21-like [Quillaja saponaria]